MERRQLLKGAAGLLGGGLLWAPTAQSESRGHNEYFARLNQVLKRQGPGRPVMVLDERVINRNIDDLIASVGRDKQYRAVVKSLPSVPLLDHVLARSGSQALMVFHQPFLNEIARSFPKADALLGKPMPVQAAHTFYTQLGGSKFNPATQVQWLIDTHDRLLQYQSLARRLGISMRVNFEINVGLNRGGFDQPNQLSEALSVVASDPVHLQVSGLMGYEPQLTGLKAELNHPAVQAVLAKYRGFIDRLKQSGYDPERLTLNGAGSHTLKIYERDHTMNDLSAGSGVVKPTDFDTFHLEATEPALFIATPILKRYQTNPVMAHPPKLREQIYYIYGGYWKARMVSPAEIGEPLYESTNQSPITTSSDIALDVDDYMFLRPTQSEFVMLQFGDLLVFDGREIRARWPVFHQTG